jgi:uncharacterized protein YggE
MRSLLAGFAFLVAFGGAFARADVIAPKPYDPAVVRVSGRAELFLPPDEARLRVSFYAPGRTAAEATGAVSARARALDAAVRGLGVEGVSVERADTTVRPVMREGGERRPDRISGYEADASVTVLVRDLDQLGRAVETAMAAQPDNFSDVAFSIREPAQARRQARQEAIADAVSKARVYTEGAGYRLGRLLLVEEGASLARAVGNVAVVDSITASDLGSFPDLNLAESVQRVAQAPLVAPRPQRYVAEVTVVFEVGAAMTP